MFRQADAGDDRHTQASTNQLDGSPRITDLNHELWTDARRGKPVFDHRPDHAPRFDPDDRYAINVSGRDIHSTMKEARRGRDTQELAVK